MADRVPRWCQNVSGKKTGELRVARRIGGLGGRVEGWSVGGMNPTDPSDRTDEEWEIPAPLVPRPNMADKDRWVVERTFAGLGQHRIHSNDYERLPRSSEGFLSISMIRNLLRRLRRPPTTTKAESARKAA
jgi:hypothetical protein